MNYTLLCSKKEDTMLHIATDEGDWRLVRRMIVWLASTQTDKNWIIAWYLLFWNRV